MKNFLALTLALLFAFPTFSQDELPKSLRPGLHTKVFNKWDVVLPFPGDLLSGISKDMPLVDYLFSSVANIDENIGLSNINVGTPTPISVGLLLGFKRLVLDNNRVDQSFTVIDAFKIGVKTSFYFTTHGVSVGAAPYVYFEILDIRQVRRNLFKLVNPIKYSFEKFKKRVKKEEDTTPSLKKMREENELYYNFLPPYKKSPRTYARFGKILNPITSAFRLPLRHDWIKKIAKDEIISYSVTGGVTFSACFGVVGNCNDKAPNTFDIGDLGKSIVKLEVFIEGKYQLTVMREDTGNKRDNFARVRVSKVKTVGVGFAAGSVEKSLSELSPHVDGFIVWKTIGGLVKIRPFSIEGKFTYSDFLNQTYRFNLNTEKGRKAYDKAVLGRFNLADEYSRDGKGNIIRNRPKAPVLRLLTRKEKRKNYNQTSGINLFLIKFWKNKTIRTSVIKETHHQEGDEEFTRFESLVLNERQMQIFFGVHSEKRSHQFFTKIDEEKITREKIPKDALITVVRVKRSDNFMTSKEYMEYISEFEDNLGYPGIFPIPPKNNKGKWDKLNLGAGSFTYNLRFNWDHIKKLVEYPEKKMWSALATAFNAKGQGWETRKGRGKRISQRLGTYAGTIPLSMVGEKFPKKDDILVANIKHLRWKHLKKDFKKGPKKFNERLAMFFNAGDYGPEMVKLLRVVNPNIKVPYSGTAKSKLFNNNKEWVFGDYARFLNPDSNENLALMEEFIKNPEKKGIKVSQLKVDALGKLYLRISFNLEETPEKVFFNLGKKNILIELRERSIDTVVVENKGGFFGKKLFKKGKNRLLFKISNKKHPLYPLAKRLDLTQKRMPKRYQLNVAASKDGRNFGSYETGIFGIYPTQSKKFLEGYLELLRKEENLCLDRAASELILLLGNRKFLVCPENAPKNLDGTCKDGFTPYGHFSNKPVKENVARRNEWIMKNCPKLGSEEYVKSVIKTSNICRGKTAMQIIDIMGSDPFYVCRPNAPRLQNGFCASGMMPYSWFSNRPLKANIRARNGWLLQTCGGQEP